MGLSDVTTMTKVGFGLSIAALLFDIIGFPTPYWIALGSFNSGLFQTCGAGVCVDIPSQDWLAASQALCIIGFLFGLACVALIVVFTFVKSEMEVLKKAGFGTSFAAGVFTIIGAAVYAAKINEGAISLTLNWSFALTIIGGILYLATGGVLVMN